MDKKVKRKKYSPPEAAFGAGEHKTPYKQTKVGPTVDTVVKSYVDHKKRPPPKRNSSWKAKGDAELVKWINSSPGRESSSPKRRHGNR